MNEDVRTKIDELFGDLGLDFGTDCQDTSEDMLLRSAKVAKLDKRREAHLLNYMHKKKDCHELLDIKNINTRDRAAPLFETIIPKCEKYRNSVLYNGAVKWNALPVKIRNKGSYNSFKTLPKKKQRNIVIFSIYS